MRTFWRTNSVTPNHQQKSPPLIGVQKLQKLAYLNIFADVQCTKMSHSSLGLMVWLWKILVRASAAMDVLS